MEKLLKAKLKLNMFHTKKLTLIMKNKLFTNKFQNKKELEIIMQLNMLLNTNQLPRNFIFIFYFLRNFQKKKNFLNFY